MKDIIIKVGKTGTCNSKGNGNVGITGENLQGSLIFQFCENFIDGVGYVEIKKPNGETGYIQATKVNKTYALPIKSSLLTQVGLLRVALRVTQAEIDSEIPVFRSQIFNLRVLEAIPATTVIPDEYPTWIDTANAKILEIDEALEEVNNLDIDATKSGTTTTVTITKKDGITKEVEIEDGEQGQTGEDGFSPIANVSKSGKVATISVTDKVGTTTATVEDGQQGERGFTGNSGVHLGTTAPTDPDVNVWVNPEGAEDNVEFTDNKVTSLSGSSTDIQYPSAKAVYDSLEEKQDTLTAGTNITIENNVISSTGGIANYDGITINENENDEIQTIGIIDQKTTNANKFWTGTLAEYNAITTKDEDTIYNITDDFTANEVPVGGTTGQLLAKSSDTDNDVSWIDAPITYTLPTATDTVLGGVKVGSNLTIDENGVLNTGDLNQYARKGNWIQGSTAVTNQNFYDDMQDIINYYAETGGKLLPINASGYQLSYISVSNFSNYRRYLMYFGLLYQTTWAYYYYYVYTTTTEPYTVYGIGSSYPATASSSSYSYLTSHQSLSNYLSKTNTTSYTPTANYHPSTKLYVDEAVAGVDLSPYLSKTNTTSYTPTSDYNPATKLYAENYANGLFAAVNQLVFKVVASLPTSNISATTIYLVSNGTSYNMNVYVEGVWELIGTTNIQFEPTVVTDTGTAYTISTLSENEVYKLGQLTSLTITSSLTFDRESIIYFASGETPTTVTLPTILINLGDVPEMVDGVGSCEASKSYIIAVLNNIAVWKCY